MPHPVQTSGITVGMPLCETMAPGTGHRSTHTAQNEVSAMQKRPCTTATRLISDAGTGVGAVVVA